MTACKECGLITSPSEPDCAARFELLSARTFENPMLYGRCHRLAVDAYCVQHSPYVKSAKSLAAHLGGLCIAFEHHGSDHAFRRLQQWLSTNPPILKPDLPPSRGALTIHHITGLETASAYCRAVDEWARAAWDAYTAVHTVARDWVRQALAASR